ncbi:exopolyphosphatase [Clostridium carnis]
MKRVGIIDIGSSSLRLMLTEVDNSGYFKIIDELKTPVRLCHDLVKDCGICSENFSSILSTLRAFKSLCTVSGADKLIVVATESFRAAQNRDILVPMIKKELNLDVKVLSCDEEIYYNFLGVLRSMYIKNSLIVKVAGTNTYIAWVKDNSIIKHATLPFGSVNLTYKYKLNDRVLRDDLETAKVYVNENLEDISWLKETIFDSIIGISSTSRNIGKIDSVRKRYPFDIPHNYELNDLDVKDIYNLVKSKDLKQRQRLDGLDPEFADIVVGGVTIFHNIVKLINCSNIFISSRGLREGLMYEYLKENYNVIDDILDYSLNGILDILNSNKNHAKNVFDITYKLFNNLKPLHHLGNEFTNIIKTSTMLHDCGISINYYSHHKHSFYVILNSYINGLTHKELIMSAAIAASHRFNNYQTPISPFSAVISQLDLKAIKQIGALLKIADGLDRSLVGAIKDFSLNINDKTVEILVYSDINVDFEIRQALRASNTFMEVYNRELIIKKKEII